MERHGQTAEDEVTNARWCTPAQLQELIERTIDQAHGRLTENKFRDHPGIEPVWGQWLRDVGYIRISAADLQSVEVLATTPPSNWPAVPMRET
ncbi:hypothetical protein [Nocardiopsis kunsanensis]|uniref:hypothetical protein n=1 Tax=Nocardiopsis kunsanensis TaxID=141693 RepID=UPI0003465E32|nr:hypothetical protein [Nocardiopsis kunsanensis]